MVSAFLTSLLFLGLTDALQDRFGIPYTPLWVSTAGRHDWAKTKLACIDTQAIGATISPRTGPPRDRSDLLAATHPSDHNAVYSFLHQGHVDALRRARLEKRERRIEREEGEGMSRNRSVGHEPAFLVPVPLYFGYVGCVTTKGRVVGGGMSVGHVLLLWVLYVIIILLCIKLTLLKGRWQLW